MSWYYGVSSLHLNGKVFNPTASPTFSNVGDMVPLPQVAVRVPPSAQHGKALYADISCFSRPSDLLQ